MNWAGRRTYTYAFLVLLLAFLPDPSAPATCPRDIFEWNTHFWAPCCCLRPFSRGVSTRRRVEEGDGGGDRPLRERGPPSWERERAPLLRRPDLSFVLSPRSFFLVRGWLVLAAQASEEGILLLASSTFPRIGLLLLLVLPPPPPPEKKGGSWAEWRSPPLLLLGEGGRGRWRRGRRGESQTRLAQGRRTWECFLRSRDQLCHGGRRRMLYLKGGRRAKEVLNIEQRWGEMHRRGETEFLVMYTPPPSRLSWSRRGGR